MFLLSISCSIAVFLLGVAGQILMTDCLFLWVGCIKASSAFFWIWHVIVVWCWFYRQAVLNFEPKGFCQGLITHWECSSYHRYQILTIWPTSSYLHSLSYVTSVGDIPMLGEALAIARWIDIAHHCSVRPMEKYRELPATLQVLLQLTLGSSNLGFGRGSAWPAICCYSLPQK